MKHDRFWPHSLVSLALVVAGAPWTAHGRTLVDLYPLALLHEPTLKAAKAAETAAELRYQQARAQLYPQLQASAESMRNHLNAQGREDSYQSANTTFQLRQPVFRPAQLRALEQSAHLSQEAQALREKAERDLLLKLGYAVFECLLAQEQMRLISSLEKATLTQLQAAEKAFAAGSGVRTDIDEARTRLDAAKVQSLQARHRFVTQQRLIERLTGAREVQLTPLAQELHSDPAAKESSLVQLWDLADAHEPQIQMARARLAAAQADVKRVDATHGPTLDLLARWTQSHSENVFNTDGKYRNRQLGVQFNWPLYDGGGAQAAVSEALAKVDEAEQRLAAVRHELHQKIEEQFRALQEGQERMRAQRQAVASAAQLVVSTQKSFSAGYRTRVDILNAEQQWQQTLRDLASARLNHLASYLQLQLLVREPGSNWLEQLAQWFEKVPAGEPQSTAGSLSFPARQ